MEHLQVNLFGAVRICEGTREIFLPGGKVGELFYYLVIKKTARREELVALLWPDASEDNAKNSLRNTLHKLKKYFAADLFLTPNKSLILLNDQIPLQLDVDQLARDPESNLGVYAGELLSGISWRCSADYEYWLTELRRYYRELYINHAQKQIAALYELKQYSAMETLIRDLLIVDGFNEKAFFFLMQLYRTQGRIDKIINEYYHLHKLLEDELGIAPPQDIEALFQEALLAVKKKDQPPVRKLDELFFYREFELNGIQAILDDFEQGAVPPSVLLKGESGAGKSTLKKKILQANENRFHFMETQCTMLERTISYSPWLKLMGLLEEELDRQQLKRPTHWDSLRSNLFFDLKQDKFPAPQILETSEQFNDDLIFKSIQNVLQILGETTKIVIVLENIQWSDPSSLRLLFNLILTGSASAMFLITAADQIGDHSDRIVNTLVQLNKLAAFDLKPFSLIEVTEILKKNLGKKDFSQTMADEIFEKSMGNPFLLNVCLDVYRNNQDKQKIDQIMKDVLKDKFSGFSETELKILRLIAVYNGDIQINFILELLDLKAFELIDSINELVRLHILEEKRDGDALGINFVHSSYREYLYGELKDMTRLLMHREIGYALERKLASKGDVQGYLKLRYHFQQAGEPVKSLKYEVIMLDYHLNFSHELFPAMDDFELSKQTKLNIKNERALAWIREAEEELQRVSNLRREDDAAELERTETLFFYCKGRYFIRCGNYQEGIRMIRRVIALSERNGDRKTELQGHKQMIIYGIQTNNAEVMLTHIIQGIKAARKLDNHLELGVFYRLYGVYHLMQGQGGTAEVLFNKSISLLQSTDRVANTNSINLAANYNYLGEIRHQSGSLDEAMAYFKKAISLCEAMEPSSLSIFYVNAAKTCFLMNDLPAMAAYLSKANRIVDQFDSFWKKPVLEGLNALHCYFSRDVAGSLKYLNNSVACVRTINNPRDIGMVYFVQAILRRELDQAGGEPGAEMLAFLDEPASVYFFQAVKYLDDYRDKAEIEYLRNRM